jgi:hypothetical protein
MTAAFKVGDKQTHGDDNNRSGSDLSDLAPHNDTQ